MKGYAKIVPVLLFAVLAVYLLRFLHLSREIAVLEEQTVTVELEANDAPTEDVLDMLSAEEGVLAFSQTILRSSSIPRENREISCDLIGLKADYILARMKHTGWILTEGRLYPSRSSMLYGVINREFVLRAFPDGKDYLQQTLVLSDNTRIRITGVLEDGTEKPIVYLSEEMMRASFENQGSTVFYVAIAGHAAAEAFLEEAENRGFMTQIPDAEQTELNPWRIDLRNQTVWMVCVLGLAAAAVQIQQETARMRREREMERSLERLGTPLRFSIRMCVLRSLLLLVTGMAAGVLTYTLLPE